MINAVNAKKSGLSSAATMQEIAAYITANWTGGSSNGNISYVRHYHSSECNKICGQTSYYEKDTIWYDGDGNERHVNQYVCNSCGMAYSYWKWTGSCTNLILRCGYSDGQILSATITY